MIVIRPEKPEDIPAMHVVNERAFGQAAEANVIARLRLNCADLLSLVAVDGDEIVGHILFSPATVESDQGTIFGMGLAPLAVVPERQRQGIGSALVNHGLTTLRAQPCPFVIVLGHPEYYTRFGFEPASGYALISQWDGVPDEAFMIVVLDRNALRVGGVHGVVRYRDEFNEAM